MNQTKEAYLDPNPIVKWAGGKSRLLPTLIERLPDEYGRYYEPLCGGAALFFALTGPATIGDINSDLMDMYRAVAASPESVLTWYRSMFHEHSDAQYYAVRELWNKGEYSHSPAIKAGMFLYLNRACYNGLWRVSQAGNFNVPVGDTPRGWQPDSEQFLAAGERLAGARLVDGDYRRILVGVEPGDFVYLDPPYHGTYNAYHAGGFGDDGQRKLAECAQELHSAGVQVMVSNSDTELIRELYRGWRLETVKNGRSIGGKGASRKSLDELIIRSY